MSVNEKVALNALEKVMEEFFSPGVSNVRKREIETQLNGFANQGDALKLCVYFLANTSSQYVTMYALSTIESVINRLWHNLDWEIKTELKSRLYTFYVEQDENAPHFIRNKLAKLLVDIAKYDWPHYYNDFFTNILILLKSDKAQLLGLVLLRTTSEEMINERCDLSSTRKDELKRLLQQNIPDVFQILISILHNLGTKPRHKATATPPPSPTQPNSTPNVAPSITTPKFRPDSKAVIREALTATQHLFSWVPLSIIPIDVISAIFNFTHISSYAQDDDDMCLLAISTLNELLYRKCAPLASHQLFVQLYHNTIQLLKDVTCTMSGRIETLSFDFIGKLSELLCLIMEQHLWRLELEPGFSAIELLSLLFQLTIQLPQLPCYLRCLSVWATFMKQIKPENAHRYAEAVQSLISAVLNKMQFIYNFSQLNELLCDVNDEDDQSEFELFIKNSIEVIAMVAEYAPLLTFNEVLIPWKNANDVYFMLQGAVNKVSCTLSLQISEYQRLHCVLRDLSTLTQTLARLSTLFIEQGNEIISTSSIADNLITKTIESASIARNVKFYHLKLTDKRLVDDFIEVQSQFLAALKTWCLWLSSNSDKSTDKFDRQMIDISLLHLKSPLQEPPKVCHASAHLFLSLSSMVFPPRLISIPEIVEFIQFAPSSRCFNKQTSEVLNSAFCNILVRSWGDLSQSDSQRRSLLINSYFNALTREFNDLSPHSLEGKINEVTGNVLPILSNLVEFCNSFPSQSKKLLYMGLKGSIEHALLLFPLYSRYPEASNHILKFFLNVLSVLQQQMGAEVTKRAIEIFLEVAISEQQSKNLSSLEKLLQILQLVIEAPGNTYKTFLPGILQLCLHNVCPIVVNQANEHPEIFVALLKLLHSILLYRWNYFFISQVRLGHSPGCSDTIQGPDKTQQPDQLLTILQVFGQALLQSDINVFRTSLNSLENLNNKWKLYHKDLFKEHLLPHFLKVLMLSLINKTHDLLTEDMQISIYNMALVSFGCFFTTFIESFLVDVSGLSTEQRGLLKESFKHDTDMPSFIQNLQRFINDICCYRMCTLPSNSVVL